MAKKKTKKQRRAKRIKSAMKWLLPIHYGNNGPGYSGYYTALAEAKRIHT